MRKFGDVSNHAGAHWLPLPLAAIVAAISCGFGGAALAAGGPQYAMKDLGTLGGKSSSATGINASGQVTGSSTLTGDQLTHGFIYTNGVMKDIGAPPGGTYSSPSGINASGQLSVNDGGNAPWIYSNGAWQDLDPQSFYPAYAWDINDSGHVTGITEGIPFFYNGTTLSFLPYQIPFSSGFGINNSDVIAGNALTGAPQGQQFGFIYNTANGSVTWIPAPGNAFYSGATAINAIGNVTGWADNGLDSNLNELPPHAYFYDTSFHDLGTLGGSTSHGNALNDSNEVVGSATLAGDAVTHAFLYSNGSMFDLNSLVTGSPLARYVTLNSGNGINNQGWIIANGVDSRTGNAHAYLLEPPSPDGTVSPPNADLIDASANTWTVSKGVVYENGRATPSGAVIELLLSKGVIYQENVHRSWWAWNGTGWVGTASPLIPSASGTSIPTAANLVDNGLNLWALSGGQVYENGALTPSGGVIQLLFDGNVVYQENLHHAWWMWNATSHAWVGSADPRVPSANETSIPPATQITDSSLNTWILSKGQVYEDGQLTPSGGVIRLLLLNNVVYQENLHDNWWKWVNGKWTACAAPLAPSANNTTIPAASQIIDNALNIWTVSGGVVYENHAPTASGDVTLLLFYGGIVYQQNVHGNWWRWTGSTWVSTPKPR